MAIQIILCMETNRKNRSDYMYINTVIHTYYSLNKDIRITPEYMDGKGNFGSTTVRKNIKEDIQQYKRTGKSVVIYCFDTDNYDLEYTDRQFIETTQSYCEMNKYEYVWFCKDIEDVFIGHTVNNSEKGAAATKFVKNKGIKDVSINQLQQKEFGAHKSNLMDVLDKYLPRK